MAQQNIVNGVKKQLNKEYCFMNDDWLEQCVEYFVTEGHTGRPNMKEIEDFVRTQYLLADLREMNTQKGTLPPKLVEKKLIFLPGSYMLQVNEMLDISKPKYRQLQIIRKAATLNSQATEEETKLEINGHTIEVTKRMMHLKMTDGVQDIVGMEYSHIPLFNEMFHPGCKILIKGPVKCRNGVLYLQAGNIEGKGGELDSLLVSNAMENVLARAVNKPENPDPFYVNIAVKNEKPKVKTDQTRAAKQPVVKQVQGRDTKALLVDDDFDINMDEILNIEASYMQSGNNVGTGTARQPVQRTQGSSATNATATTATTSANRPSKAQPDKMNENRENANKYMKEERKSSINIVNDENQDRFHQVLSKECSRQEEPELISSDEDYGPLENIEPGEESDDMDRILEADPKGIELERRERDVRGWSPYVTEPGGEDNDGLIVCNEISLSNLSVKDSGHPNNTENRSVPKRNSISSDTGTSAQGASESPKSQKEDSNSAKRPKRYESLCDVVAKKITCTKTVEIKARISEMGHLTKEKCSWAFSCTISDGTASMDVTFPNNILQNIIGLSAQEFSQKKKQRKTDPQIDLQLRIMLKRAEDMLSSIDILEIKVKEGEKPEVVNVSS